MYKSFYTKILLFNVFLDDQSPLGSFDINHEEQESYSDAIDNSSDLDDKEHDDSGSRSPLQTSCNSTLKSCFKEDLRNTALKHEVSHSFLNDLLKILRKHDCFQNLPLDARTLLQTPAGKTNVITMAPGLFYHFGLKNQIENELMKWEKRQNLELFQKLLLSINIDGLPLFKSSNVQVWPILGRIRNLESQVFIISIYQGEKKPNDVNAFLYEFVVECSDLINNGLHFNGKVYEVLLDSLICDAPAKAFVCQTKGHTGYSSCTKCTVEGVYEKNRLSFPDINAKKRTGKDFVNREDEEYHIGYSIIQEIPKFDIVKNTPLDYMHLICLSVIKKLIKDL